MKTDLVEIFQTIRATLQPYATLGFSNRKNSETAYDLWSDKNVLVDGVQKHELFFISVTIEEDHVALHYNAVSDQPEIKGLFDPKLLKLLKEESSFHFKTLDDEHLSLIGSAIAAGYKLYKERGWIE